MTNKEFLQKYPLQYSLPLEECEAFRKVLSKACEAYALDIEEELGVNSGGVQYYDFRIHCTTTGFAEAYAHIGLEYAQHVLPIWKERHAKKK